MTSASTAANPPTAMPARYDIVARVGHRRVTVAQLEARLDAIYRGPLGLRLPLRQSTEGKRVRRWAASMLATEALLLDEAEQHGVVIPPVPARVPSSAPVSSNGADPMTERAVQVAATGLFSALTADIAIAEDEARRYYDANPDLWRIGGPDPASYSDVRPRIVDDLLALARGQVFDDWLIRRRTELIVLMPGFEQLADPSGVRDAS